MKRLLRTPFFLIALLLLVSGAEISPLEEILQKLQQYHKDHPQQKLYVHLDKPSYTAGESIWFKAYVMEASLHHLDSQSRVMYAELINDQSVVFNRQMLYVSNGMAFGDFQLPDTLSQGKYILRAYTNFMRNTDEDFLFAKEFLVINPSRMQKIQNQKMLSPDSIVLRFFPEGGNLVACGFNRVAFKATSPDGRSVAVEGKIVDEENKIIATFKTQHEGMGIVNLNPVPNKRYYASITKPQGVTRAYALPLVHEKGYVMQVNSTERNIKIVVFTNAVTENADHTVNLVVQSRGKAYHAQQATIKNNGFFTNIPKSKFPEGISQITLFDSQGRPVAERLVHVDHQEQITLSIQTDTALYGKRKQVALYAQAKYSNGAPAVTNLSVSVYDELLTKGQEKYPLSMTNYLTLTSDLKGYVENPGYYFKDSLVETKRNLDLLMMVHGWRRFTWSDVLAAETSALLYRHEAGIPIRGKVLKISGKNPPAGSILKVMTMNGKVVRLSPDSLGRFYTDSLLYYDSTTLVFQTENSKGKKQPYKFMLDPFISPLYRYIPASSIKQDTEPEQQKKQDDEKPVFNSKTVVFSEFAIVAKKERDPQLVGIPGLDRVIDIKQTGTQYSDVMDLVQYKIPLTQITGKMPDLVLRIRGIPVKYCINGSPVDDGLATSIPVTSIKYVEVLRSVNYSVPCNINIIMNMDDDRVPIGINKARHPGLYEAREFYSPDYFRPDERHKESDRRTTLLWEPMIQTDANGVMVVKFYTNDVTSRYRIMIEGITVDGYPASSSASFDVAGEND